MADIAKHSGKTNSQHIERLWRNVPVQLARAQNSSAPKFRFKDAVPGLRGYERLFSPLDWLENARLVLRTSIVSRAETPLVGFARDNRFKQYFFDVGLLSSLNVFEKRYHPQQSVVLSALNLKTHGCMFRFMQSAG